MNDAIFSMQGRLTRRDYAMTVGALMGGAALMTFAAFTLLLPLVYLAAAAFFRETSVAFWVLFFSGILFTLTLVYSLLPLLAVPATVRRLHDIGRGGGFAAPLVFASLLILCFLAFFLLSFLGGLESLTGVPVLSLLFSGGADEVGAQVGIFFVSYIFLCMFSMFVLSAYGAWIFLKQGTPAANRYGEVPIEEELPPFRTAYLSAAGTIDRRRFAFRVLILLAAAGIIVPTLVQSVIYPVALILTVFGILPAGTNYFVLMTGVGLYPLAALPLVLRRLRTLGRSSYEAVLPFAILLPNILSSAVIAQFLDRLLAVLDDGAIADAVIAEFFVMGSMNDTVFIALWSICGILSLIGVLRLMDSDDREPAA